LNSKEVTFCLKKALNIREFASPGAKNQNIKIQLISTTFRNTMFANLKKYLVNI
jgi:hypothetical protein